MQQKSKRAYEPPRITEYSAQKLVESLGPALAVYTFQNL